MSNIKFDKILGKVREKDFKNFIFTQAVAAMVWNINHNLGRKPSVTILDNSGCRIYASEVHIDINNTQITFIDATAGTAELN